MTEGHIISLGIGFILDLAFGDPSWIPHPIRGMGRTIAGCEKLVRGWSRGRKGRLLAGGCILVMGNLLIWGMVPLLICLAAYRLHPYAGIAVEGFLCFQLLAAKSLRSESMKVYNALKDGTIEEARHAVSMIVGRDTRNLTEEGVTRAAVETVAENLADGVIAPMLYMAAGGAFFGYLYKVVNTMDSMVGYKNDRYLYFGRAAAKLDDVLNFIPARLSAWLMIGASYILGLDSRNAVKIYRRDRRNHASPNSAHTEAVCAGALGVMLAGDAWYFGTLHKKQTIGDAGRPVEAEDIRRAGRLLYMTSFLAIVIAVTVLA